MSIKIAQRSYDKKTKLKFLKYYLKNKTFL